MSVAVRSRDNFPGLHLVGRNGMHKYNNQDHAMMTAMLTAENILAGRELFDVWEVNQDADDHKESGNRGEVGRSWPRVTGRETGDEGEIFAGRTLLKYRLASAAEKNLTVIVCQNRTDRGDGWVGAPCSQRRATRNGAPSRRNRPMSQGGMVRLPLNRGPGRRSCRSHKGFVIRRIANRDRIVGEQQPPSGTIAAS